MNLLAPRSRISPGKLLSAANQAFSAQYTSLTPSANPFNQLVSISAQFKIVKMDHRALNMLEIDSYIKQLGLKQNIPLLLQIRPHALFCGAFFVIPVLPPDKELDETVKQDYGAFPG